MALKLPKIVSQDNVIKILSKINTRCPTGCRNYAIIMTMYRAGLRVSEICNLTLSDVNFNTGLIYVQQGKGGKDRYVPMDSDIKKAMQAWLKIRPESQYFFCTLKGGQIDTRYVREMCYRLSRKANVYIQDGIEKKPVSPHKFRHSCLTSLLKEGFNIRQVQEIAGHSNLNTTMIYTHVIIDDLKEKMQNRKPLSV